MILQDIINIKRKIIEGRKKKLPFAQLVKLVPSYPGISIKKNIEKNGFGIIAEVKKSSPSAGILKKRYQPEKIAKIYEKYGVSGISVLTCEPYFLGNISHLKKVREKVKLPILQKDFIIDKYQIFEGKYYGADCILLIVKILSENNLHQFCKTVEQLKMEAIIEIHDKKDLKKALTIRNWRNKILGINNRNLKTLKTDIKVSFNLIKSIPKDKIMVISESGIKNSAEVKKLKENGIKGILIGETILKSRNIRRELQEIMSGNK